MWFVIRAAIVALAIPYLAWYGIVSIRATRRPFARLFDPREHAVCRWILYVLTVVLIVDAGFAVAAAVAALK